MTNEEIYKPKTICAVDIPGNELEYVLSKSKLGEALDEARKDEAEKIIADVRNKLGPFQTLLDLLDAYVVFDKDHVKSIYLETISKCEENIQLFKNRT